MSGERYEKFVNGDRSAVIFPARAAALLEHQIPALQSIRVAQFGNGHPDVYSLLLAIHHAAQAFNDSAAATRTAQPAQPPGVSNWLEVSQAAGLLQMSPSAVRKAIKNNRLAAAKTHDRWLIRRDEVKRYAATRRRK